MKKIKSFNHFSDSHSVSKLFESVDTEEMWKIFDDIKSLEYIIEEGEYRIIYNFLFADQHSRGRYHTSLQESSVRSMMENNIPLDEFVGFRIEVFYPKDQVGFRLTQEQIEKLGSDTERYCSLLGDHLDYPESPVTSVKSFSSDTGKNIIKVMS